MSDLISYTVKNNGVAFIISITRTEISLGLDLERKVDGKHWNCDFNDDDIQCLTSKQPVDRRRVFEYFELAYKNQKGWSLDILTKSNLMWMRKQTGMEFKETNKYLVMRHLKEPTFVFVLYYNERPSIKMLEKTNHRLRQELKSSRALIEEYKLAGTPVADLSKYHNDPSLLKQLQKLTYQNQQLKKDLANSRKELEEKEEFQKTAYTSNTASLHKLKNIAKDLKKQLREKTLTLDRLYTSERKLNLQLAEARKDVRKARLENKELSRKLETQTRGRRPRAVTPSTNKKKRGEETPIRTSVRAHRSRSSSMRGGARSRSAAKTKTNMAIHTPFRSTSRSRSRIRTRSTSRTGSQSSRMARLSQGKSSSRLGRAGRSASASRGMRSRSTSINSRQRKTNLTRSRSPATKFNNRSLASGVRKNRNSIRSRSPASVASRSSVGNKRGRGRNQSPSTQSIRRVPVSRRNVSRSPSASSLKHSTTSLHNTTKRNSKAEIPPRPMSSAEGSIHSDANRTQSINSMSNTQNGGIFSSADEQLAKLRKVIEQARNMTGPPPL